MSRNCKKCSCSMNKVSSMLSSNATFETWQCQECDFREQICIGLTF